MIFKLGAKVQTIGQTSFALEQKPQRETKNLNTTKILFPKREVKLLKQFFQNAKAILFFAKAICIKHEYIYTFVCTDIQTQGSRIVG